MTSIHLFGFQNGRIYEIKYFEKSHLPPSLETIASVAYVELMPQKIMGSIPRLALSTAIAKLNLNPNRFTDKVNIDISLVYDLFLKFTGYSPFGSVILYNYNTIGLNNYSNYIEYIEILKNKYSITLKLHNKYNNKKYLVKIIILNITNVLNILIIYFCNI
jgi:hypothetical protein